MNDKRSYLILYIAIASAFIATFASQDLPGNIVRIARQRLPAEVLKSIDLASFDFSTLTIGFVGALITFGLFVGIGLLLLGRKDDTQG